jgi:hypothetical protein
MPRRKKKKFHFLYKTINLLNGKFYIGAHSTNNLEDGYLGSGRLLRYSINKNGIENFQIERLEFFEDKEKLFDREKEIVNESLLRDPSCMNLMIGGRGGFISEEQQKNRASLGGKATKKRIDLDPEFAKNWSKKSSETMKNLHKNGKIKIPDWTGRKHSEETKNKIRKSRKNINL